jgi:hypothetical protein
MILWTAPAIAIAMCKIAVSLDEPPMSLVANRVGFGGDEIQPLCP